MQCEKCGVSESIMHKNGEEILCFDCLISELGLEEKTETHYVRDGEYVASENNISDILQAWGVEEIETGW